MKELGRVRMSNFSLAKINCHRNYGKVFAFTRSKEKVLKKLCYRIFVNVSLFVLQAGCLSHPTSLINASKPVKTLSHFPRYRETLSNVFRLHLGLHEQI